MGKCCEKLKDEEGGALILEFSYCFMVVIIVILILFSFGFYAYQKVMMGITCNQVTEHISNTYKYEDIDLKLVERNELTDSEFMQAIDGVNAYRYMFTYDELANNNWDKADKFLKYKLLEGGSISFAKPTGQPDVELETVRDGTGRHHYKVRISMNYEFLFADIISGVGIELNPEISYEAYGEDTDISNYLNCMKDCVYGRNHQGSSTLDSSAAEAVEFWRACFEN